MVEVPEVEGVMRERRNRHRAKQAVAGAVVVVVLVGVVSAAFALRGIGGNSSHPQVVTQPQIIPPIEFRLVGGTVPYSAADAVPPTTVPEPSTTAPLGSTAILGAVMTSCGDGAAVTPPDQIRAAGLVILPDRPDKNGKHHVCYTLGPRLLDGSGIGKVVVNYDPSQGGYVLNITFKNDDFANKIAKRYVHRQVAVVVDGVVQAAPTISGPISGRDVQISGNYTRDQAIALAAKLLGVKPSQVSVQGPSPNQELPVAPAASTPFSYPRGLLIGGIPTKQQCLATSACEGELQPVTRADILAVTTRQAGSKTWVVDVTLSPDAAARLRQPRLGADAAGEPANAILHGSTVELSRINAVGWSKAEANAAAQAIIAGR
jgi:hypothetical protein